MRASYVTFAAFALLAVGRWANGKPAANIATVAAAVFVILVVAALDGGATEDIAKGVAWLLLAVVVLNPDSPITAIARLINSQAQAATGATTAGGPQIAKGQHP